MKKPGRRGGRALSTDPLRRTWTRGGGLPQEGSRHPGGRTVREQRKMRKLFRDNMSWEREGNQR